MHKYAAVVSYHDIKSYFSGDAWSFQVQDGGGIKATSPAFEVNLDQKTSKYEVKITATDDPSDSEETVTDDPVKFITKFLSTGTEGADDLLKKMSTYVADPRFISELARRAALMLDISPGDLSSVRKMLRRGIVAAYGPGADRILVAVVRAVAGAGDDANEVKKVTEDMKKKGWKVTQDEEDGRAVLKVDVSGIYTAEIRAKDTVWNYSFQVNEFPESKEEGTTDDPIQKFRLFYKKDSTEDFRKQLKEKKKSGDDGEEVDTDATVKPGKEPPKKKKKEPTGPPDSGTESTLMAPTQLPPSRVPDVTKENKWSD